jgi:NitT/TauT family transport system substrate-binding protein
MWRGVIGLVVAALALLASGAPSAPARAASPAVAAPLTAELAAQGTGLVNVGVLGILGDAPFYLARDRGYLAEQGLTAEFQLFDSGARMVPALATGQLDVAPGSPSVGLYNAVSRGVTAKLVADWVSSAPGGPAAFYTVRKDLIDSGDVRDLSDLRGRRIAITALGTSVHALAGRALERGGAAPTDADIVEMGFPDMLPGLASGALDVAVLVEPFVARAEDQGIGVRWHSSEDVVPGQVAASVMYGPSLLEQRPDVGRRFMVAYLKALRDYYGAFVAKDPAVRAQVIPLLIQATNYKDPALYDRIQLHSVNPDGHINVAALETDYRWYVAQGLIGDIVNLGQLVDGQFVDYALQQVGRYAR